MVWRSVLSLTLEPPHLHYFIQSILSYVQVCHTFDFDQDLHPGFSPLSFLDAISSFCCGYQAIWSNSALSSDEPVFGIVTVLSRSVNIKLAL
jgi:hypothetical protein